MSLLFFYPKVSKFFPNYSGWNTLEEKAKSKTDLFDRIIEEHFESLQADAPRDFMDVYLMEINRTENKESSFHPKTGS